jgi:hypothetical protein
VHDRTPLKRTVKVTTAQKRTRSANDPVMSAGVMIANFRWNRAKMTSGMVGASPGCVAVPTCRNMKNVRGSPITPPMSSPKARLKPTTTHTMLMTIIAIRLWSIVEMTFFLRTMPP